jgi:hypothetical protein
MQLQLQLQLGSTVAAQQAAEADGRGLQPARSAVLDTDRRSIPRGRSLAAIRWAAKSMSTNAIVFESPRHWNVWGKLDITAFFRAVEALLPASY